MCPQAGASAAGLTTAAGVVNNLLSTQEGQASLETIAVGAAVAGGAAMAQSIATDALATCVGDNAAPLVDGAAAAVTVVYQAVHGDTEAALKTGLTKAANTLLDKVSGELPLSLKHTTEHTLGGLGNELSKTRTRTALDYNLLSGSGAAVGAHVDHETSTRRDGAHTVQREAVSAGVHAGWAGVADVSVGIGFGIDQSDIVTTLEGGEKVDRSYQDRYYGRVQASMKLGNRSGSTNRGPTFASHRVDTEVRTKADGTAYAQRHSDQMRYVANRASSAPPPSSNVDSNHEAVASAITEQYRQQDGHTELVTGKRKDTTTSKLWFGAVSSEHTTHSDVGRIIEANTCVEDSRVEGDLHKTRLSRKVATSSFEDKRSQMKNGQVVAQHEVGAARQEQLTSTADESIVITTKEGGAPLAPSRTTTRPATGSEAAPESSVAQSTRQETDYAQVDIDRTTRTVGVGAANTKQTKVHGTYKVSRAVAACVAALVLKSSTTCMAGCGSFPTRKSERHIGWRFGRLVQCTT